MKWGKQEGGEGRHGRQHVVGGGMGMCADRKGDRMRKRVQCV